MKKLIKELAKREGRKSQVSIGNLRETLKHLTDIMAEYGANDHHADLMLEFNQVILKKAHKLEKKKAKANK